MSVVTPDEVREQVVRPSTRGWRARRCRVPRRRPRRRARSTRTRTPRYASPISSTRLPSALAATPEATEDRSAVAWASSDEPRIAATEEASDGDAQGGQPRGVGRRPRVQQLRHADRRGRVEARSSTPRSTPASTTSTPPTSTARAARRSSSGRALGSRRRRSRDHHQGRDAACPRVSAAAASRYVTRHCDESLARLGTDSHRPLPPAPARPRDADRARRSRRSPSSSPPARCSRSAAPTSAARSSKKPSTVAQELGVPRFVNVQNDFSLLNRSVEADVLPVCERLDVVLMPYFPLASGMLTGKYRRGEEHPEGSRLAAWGPMAEPVRQRGEVRRRRAAGRVRGGARSHAARARALVAGGHARRSAA